MHGFFPGLKDIIEGIAITGALVIGLALIFIALNAIDASLKRLNPELTARKALIRTGDLGTRLVALVIGVPLALIVLALVIHGLMTTSPIELLASMILGLLIAGIF